MVRFHQERLVDGAEREQQRSYWGSILNRLDTEIAEG